MKRFTLGFVQIIALMFIVSQIRPLEPLNWLGSFYKVFFCGLKLLFCSFSAPLNTEPLYARAMVLVNIEIILLNDVHSFPVQYLEFKLFWLKRMYIIVKQTLDYHPWTQIGFWWLDSHTHFIIGVCFCIVAKFI